MEESKPLQDSLLTHYSTVVESKGGTEVHEGKRAPSPGAFVRINVRAHGGQVDVAEEGLAAVVARVRKGFNSGVTRKLDWRKQQLRAIVRMVRIVFGPTMPTGICVEMLLLWTCLQMRENFEAFSEALRADLGATEFWITVKYCWQVWRLELDIHAWFRVARRAWNCLSSPLKLNTCCLICVRGPNHAL